MRLGETGPRERRRWGGFLIDTDMTGRDRKEEERSRRSDKWRLVSSWKERLGSSHRGTGRVTSGAETAEPSESGGSHREPGERRDDREIRRWKELLCGWINACTQHEKYLQAPISVPPPLFFSYQSFVRAEWSL